jgi:nitrite reductase/ring-hydroxylating ferredoxin subunit
MGAMTRLCALDDIADDGAAEFDLELGGVRRFVLAVRLGETVHVYLDYCPHMGYPRHFVNMRFLMVYSKKVTCSVHGGCFRREDGAGTSGPPSGDFLGRFETRVENGEVYVGETLFWPGEAKAMAKRQALIDAYLAQQKARETNPDA